jgi:zinc protease
MLALFPSFLYQLKIMRRAILALLIVVFWAFPARAAQVQEFVLDNGLKVLLLEDHKSPAVTFQVWYRVGSRNELDGKSGLSHFLEHMMFKGTPTTGPEQYSRIIATNGGRSNAFTSADHTVYFATMSREKIGVEIELEADRMANAILDGATFEAEKQVVMEERRLRTEDSPAAALGEVMGAVEYTVHPYRRPVIGWMGDLEKMSREDLRQHYKLYYAPNNAFIVAVGDFSTAEMLTKIKGEFGKLPRGAEAPKIKVEEPPQRGERRVTLKKEAELPFLAIDYRAPNVKDPENFSLDLLAVVLAGGRSSRLHQELVYHQRIARNVGADYGGLSLDPGMFSITAQVMPEKQTEEVEKAVDAIVERLRTEAVGDKELEKAKNQVEAAFVFGQDSVFGQAMRIGQYESVAGWRLLDQYLEGIRKVTAADLLRVAKKYLDPDQRTVGVLIPVKEKAQ